MYLLDKSAFEQRRRSVDVARRLEADTIAGLVAVCEIVVLEILYSARNPRDYTAMRTSLDALPWLPVTGAVMDRAVEVQGLLAQRGQHRRPIPDLVIAATAEVHGATVLHFDKDFDLIAEVTGQPVSWIASSPEL